MKEYCFDICIAEKALNKPILPRKIEEYTYLMASLYHTDVSSDLRYQKIFRDFWAMKRFYDADFARDYFSIMEELKSSHKSVTFTEIFKRTIEINGKAQMSFSSKMLHSFNPEYPIWDSKVTEDHFGFRKPYPYERDKVKAYSARYNEYMVAFYKYLTTDNAKTLIQMFDTKFPGLNITDTKKLDFVLWQDRD